MPDSKKSRKKILVVDDSAVIRRYLISLFQKHGYSVDFAKNGREALQKLKQERFSLVTLDIEMPVLDGIETLRAIMEERPTRVLMISSYVKDNSDLTLEALKLGAIDYIPKPKSSLEIAKVSDEIIRKVETALNVLPRFLQNREIDFKSLDRTVEENIEMGFVLIGASTGGPRLIEQICKALPEGYPHSVCVVQHMPAEFTGNFARRLNALSSVEVVEASEGMALQRGRVIIAKGGKHLHFRKKLKQYVVTLKSNLQERYFVPSVDEMFFSAADVLPTAEILAIELTGIGDDGADGMVKLRNKGAYTIAESEKTAVVYGMPKEAALRGGADRVLDFGDIVKEILAYGKTG